MPKIHAKGLDATLEALPKTYAGPGGAVAVLHEGEVLVRHAWGFANAERRIPFTPRTLFRMCSITKQFTCGVALETFPDLSVLDGDVSGRLPLLKVEAPTAAHLAHNQSGLRDYWAVAMLLGSPAEAPFGDHDATRVISETRSLHFTPGTQFSYVNQNFRLLSDIVADRTGETFADLLRTRIFDRVGMETAFLAADTRAMPDGAEGYEGNVATGFRAAENRIVWTGDAGLGASLDDMIAWERHIDATRDDPDALYSRLSAPVAFADGAPAGYGFGLGRSRMFGRSITGHGGALRGWRSHRLYSPADRLSVVVMFNHFGNAFGAAMDVFASSIGETPPKPNPAIPTPEWLGAYIEPDTGLAARIEPGAPGTVRLKFGHAPTPLDLNPDGSAGLDDGARLRHGADGLALDRLGDNARSLLQPLLGSVSKDIAGIYRCEELGSDLTIVDTHGVIYGAFSGLLGQGRMELLEAVGPDVWALPCPRALDHTPPGDWTLRFRRGADNRTEGVQVGCWLARGLDYRRLA